MRNDVNLVNFFFFFFSISVKSSQIFKTYVTLHTLLQFKVSPATKKLDTSDKKIKALMK